MPKYRVGFTTSTYITIDVEADDPEAAIEEALTEGADGICAHCAGLGQTWLRNESDELKPITVTDLATDEDVWTASDPESRP